MIRVLLVDDEIMVRKGLRMRMKLEPDLLVIGETSSGLQALAMAEALHPDIVVMDIELTDLDGISATAQMAGSSNPIPVIIHSMHDDVLMRTRALDAGAAEFVVKHGGPTQLLSAIRRIHQQSPPTHP
jgi:DNA-binding NarL/FixJ family response regulator